MAAIMQAVTSSRAGDQTGARTTLLDLWHTIGPHGDPLHRCTLAHYLADLYDDPAEALAWDVRALDAADGLSNERAGEYHASLDVRGFYPSLHLNLADNYRRLGSFEAAQREIDAARRCLDVLADDAYGTIVRDGVAGVAAAIEARSTDRRH